MAQGGLNIFSGDLFTELAVLKSKHSEDSDLVVFKRRVRTPVETLMMMAGRLTCLQVQTFPSMAT